MVRLTEGEKMVRKTVEGVLLNAIVSGYDYTHKKAEKVLMEYVQLQSKVVKR